MVPLDYPTHWRMVHRTLGEDLLEFYMMRTLEENLSGSSDRSLLVTRNGYRSLPSYMVPQDLVSLPCLTSWSFYSKGTQLRLMRALLDPVAISSQPLPSPRVRSWLSIRMGTYQGLSLMGFLTVPWHMRPSLINEKGVKRYPKRINAILFIGTNKPVKITDSKSG